MLHEPIPEDMRMSSPYQNTRSDFSTLEECQNLWAKASDQVKLAIRKFVAANCPKGWDRYRWFFAFIRNHDTGKEMLFAGLKVVATQRDFRKSQSQLLPSPRDINKSLPNPLCPHSWGLTTNQMRGLVNLPHGRFQPTPQEYLNASPIPIRKPKVSDTRRSQGSPPIPRAKGPKASPSQLLPVKRKAVQSHPTPKPRRTAIGNQKNPNVQRSKSVPSQVGQKKVAGRLEVPVQGVRRLPSLGPVQDKSGKFKRGLPRADWWNE